MKDEKVSNKKLLAVYKKAYEKLAARHKKMLAERAAIGAVVMQVCEDDKAPHLIALRPGDTFHFDHTTKFYGNGLSYIQNKHVALRVQEVK